MIQPRYACSVRGLICRASHAAFHQGEQVGLLGGISGDGSWYHCTGPKAETPIASTDTAVLPETSLSLQRWAAKRRESTSRQRMSPAQVDGILPTTRATSSDIDRPPLEVTSFGRGTSTS